MGDKRPKKKEKKKNTATEMIPIPITRGTPPKTTKDAGKQITFASLSYAWQNP
jgi:hypothetical protein